MRFFRLPVVVALAVTTTLVISTISSAAVTLTSVEGWPNGRIVGDNPPNAVDGNTSTYTWTTNPSNTFSPSYLGVGFDSTPIDRIRVWKTPESGWTSDENSKNLIIQYTSDNSAIALDARTWQNVDGLTSGYFGTELFHAALVSPGGTVTGDVHDSPGVFGSPDGWGSLSFTKVMATGVRIGFANSNGNSAYTHYRVGELQVVAAVPEPISAIVFLASCVFIGASCRYLGGSKAAAQ